jgi:hypothetical protein
MGKEFKVTKHGLNMLFVWDFLEEEGHGLNIV